MWATPKHIATVYDQRRGFTIVELLIVIVVIGILAAITVVAYRGIQQRATTAAVNSAVDQWEKIIRMEGSLQGDDMPAGISCLGSSIEDFPETADFPEGVCVIPDSNPLNNIAYDDSAFSDWQQSSRPKAGELPTTKVTLDGNQVIARGIFFISIPSTHTGTNRGQVGIYWIPQIAGECGRGSDVSGEEAGSLAGGYCKIVIEF